MNDVEHISTIPIRCIADFDAEEYVLAEMMNGNPVDERFVESCHRLRELHLRREAIKVAQAMIDACYNLDTDPWRFLDELRRLAREHATAENLYPAWREEVRDGRL